ncbi:DNA replication and repair protein RadC [Sulfurivirga caldicuralii]|uniref:DNA replication and repair protein RadC n=1 Tax=Sulfurivirga caldicuralii TaxID=364032 RepID=A0A1N6DN55_9GAMM|nr:DNA repair protein RadC [Sulfurivirga caldicuralii]SIN72176.1 DNA replication and repair protein RadC [Sulfurivirga caldicuralii]
MAIKDWPASERPREKLLRYGAEALTDAELLAIFLRTGVTGISAVELAQQLLDHFGSLAALMQADLDTFCEAKGLGQAKYVQLQATLEMARRTLRNRLQTGQAFDSAETAGAYCQHLLGGRDHEAFAALYLDAQHRLIEDEILFRGTLTETAVHPREVARNALRHNAAAVIVAHNHPSGMIAPSEADRQLTQRLSKALELLGIRLLDHLIVTDRDWFSLQRNDPFLFQ